MIHLEPTIVSNNTIALLGLLEESALKSEEFDMFFSVTVKKLQVNKEYYS